MAKLSVGHVRFSLAERGVLSLEGWGRIEEEVRFFVAFIRVAQTVFFGPIGAFYGRL
ncbi:MAG: hypothetical protein ACSNEK_04620 [Parachlamydiaceae bacterium]